MLIYHRGRLIKPFLRVGIQLQNSEAGTGVVGVINASFLQPTHNKQVFIFSQNGKEEERFNRFSSFLYCSERESNY